MGCCCSCRRTSELVGDNIRVVDINGYVQDFDYPIIARQLTGSSKLGDRKSANNSVKFFVSTAEKLLSSTGSKQLGPETQLHPGHVYFLLPFSTLSESLTPMDYVGLVTKLNSVAKTAPTNTIYDLSNNKNLINSQTQTQTQTQKKRRYNNYGRKRSWKPILSTIRERSFNRRSESDLLRHSEDDIDQLEDLIN